MGIIIGGSGSTGSSLLAQMLNRHSAIFCGPETALFTKTKLYTEWAKAKKKIPGKGLKGDGWHRYNGIDLSEESFGLSVPEIQIMAESAQTFREFVDMLFAEVLKRTGKKIWAEKTPSNAIFFPRIRALFPDILFIHCVRDPYDTIASLINRGFNEFYATSLYLVNTSSALACRQDLLYSEIDYENLVTNPEGTLTKVLSLKGLEFESGMLHGTETNVHIPGWEYAETGKIGTKSIGRFHRLPDNQKQRIIEACHWIRINPEFGGKYGIDLWTIEELCRHFNYPFHFSGILPNARFRRLFLKEYLERWLKAYPNVGQSFPVLLNPGG